LSRIQKQTAYNFNDANVYNKGGQTAAREPHAKVR